MMPIFDDGTCDSSSSNPDLNSSTAALGATARRFPLSGSSLSLPLPALRARPRLRFSARRIKPYNAEAATARRFPFWSHARDA